jgi:hypothetical protein
MVMTLLGREMPSLSAEVLFSDIELQTLGAYAKKTNEAAFVFAGCCTSDCHAWWISGTE